MSEEFKREIRYDVVKLKTGKKINCVVVEEDWPEYEIVWKMIQDRMEGRPNELFATKQKLEAAEAENAELTRKLAEQQAHTEKMREVLLKAFQKITCYSGLEVCGDIEDVINNIGTAEELTKLIAEAKSKAVPEGWQLVPKYHVEQMAAAFYEANRTWFWDCYAAMLAAAPQPKEP